MTAQAGSWSTPAGAGNAAYSYRWQDCDVNAVACNAIAGGNAQTYSPTASDIGHTLRVLVTASDNDGQASTASELSAIIPAPPTGGEGAPTMSLGVPNGFDASASARLQITSPGRVTRSYRHRAITIGGHLTEAMQEHRSARPPSTFSNRPAAHRRESSATPSRAPPAASPPTSSRGRRGRSRWPTGRTAGTSAMPPAAW